MAITYNTAVRDIVQEAFNILRQDFSAPAVSDTPVDIDQVADTSNEWLKARISIKTSANEVFDSFGWGGTYTAEGISSWSAKMRNALVYTLARELAIPIAGRMEDMKVFATLASDKLVIAKVRALNDALDAVSDADTEEVIAQIRESFQAGEKTLPHSVSSVVGRIETMKDAARHDVLLAHDWNFACVSEPAGSDLCERTEGEYRWRHPVPQKAMRLIAVYGPLGRLNEWKIENREICAREPIAKIRFLRDVADVSKWSPIARPLYVMRLKALVARTVMGNAQDAAMQEQLYERALADAKLADARESNTPNDPWGDNHYAEAMRGMTGDFRREPPFWRR